MHCAIWIGDQHDVDACDSSIVVGCTTLLTTYAAIAVFGDFGASRRSNEHRSRGNAEGARQIATGTDDVDQAGLLSIGTLVDSSRITIAAAVISPMASSSDAQSHEEGSSLRRREFTRHELAL